MNKENLRNHNSQNMWSLRQDIVTSGFTIALDRAECYTKVFAQHEAAPWIVKKALAFREHLNTMPLYLRKYDQLPGSICETPGAMPLFPELGIGENQIFVRENPEYENYLDGKVPEHISSFWKGRDSWSAYKAYCRDVLGTEGGSIPDWIYTSCQAHLSPDLRDVLAGGLKSVKAAIELEKGNAVNPDKISFLHAARLSINALGEWILRYASLLESMAKSETDQNRAAQLRKMAADSSHIANEPPQTFRQAIMLIWYIYQAMHIEGNGYSCSPGRLDQLLYKFYLADKKNGILTDDDVISLFENFILKMKDNTFWSEKHNLTQGLCVAGSAADGNDLSMARGVIRSLGYFIGLALSFTGFALAYITKDKRALQDYMAGSVVVSVREKTDSLFG